MAEYVGNTTRKKLIQIDISADTVCPWCFIGNRNLDKAIAISKDQYDFELRFHPFQLNPSAPKEGIVKKEFYRSKFGSQAEGIIARMTEGNSLDSHRLIYCAGLQGLDKQDHLVEELCFGYFTKGKYIGDRGFLLEAASKAGVEGVAEFLQDPNGLNEINKKHQLDGGHPFKVFLKVFEAATS